MPVRLLFLVCCSLFSVNQSTSTVVCSLFEVKKKETPSEVKGSQVDSSELKWSEVKLSGGYSSGLKWTEVKWSEVNWTELKCSAVRWRELKGNEANWSEGKRSEVKWRETKRSEVKGSGWHPLPLPSGLFSQLSYCIRNKVWRGETEIELSF